MVPSALRRVLTVLVVLILQGVHFSPVVRAQAAPPPDDEITRSVTALVDRYRELGWFNGAVLVARGDKVLYQGAAGLANLDHRIALTPESPTRIVGVTQLFTTALTLKLVELGTITLDTPVGKFMTRWPDAFKPITIHQLLTGTSGVKDVTQIPEFVRTVAVPRSLYELTQLILKEGPIAAPGTTGRAYNSDYHLLAAVLETAAGVPFDTLLRQHILTPLALSHTFYDDPSVVIAGRAVGMNRRGADLSHASLFHMSNAVGMAHLVSTVGDVHRFVDAFMSGRIVSPALVATAARGHVSVLPPGVTLPPTMRADLIPMRGYGWNVSAGQLSSITSINGATASVQYLTSTRHLVVVLSNVSSGEGSALANAIRSLLAGTPQTLPERRQPVPLSEADRATMTGTWNVEGAVTVGGGVGGLRMTVRTDGARMLVSVGGGPESEWYSDGPGRLYDPHADRQFVLGATPDSASLITAGRPGPLSRVR